MNTDPAFAAGFYGPSMVFPNAPVPVYGTSPAPVMVTAPAPVPMVPMVMAPPVMYVDPPIEKTPTVPRHICPDTNSASHRAFLWGGLLAFFSTATFVNGMIRFVQAIPAVVTKGGDARENYLYFTPVVYLIAEIFSVVIGLAGFLLGLSEILFDAVQGGICMITFCICAVFASYLWAVEVFAKPIYELSQGTSSLTGTAATLQFGSRAGQTLITPTWMERRDQNALVVFSSIFTWFAYFVTSVGMILLCMLELRAAVTGALETVRGAQLKMRIMSLCVFVTALGDIVCAGVVYTKLGVWQRTVFGANTFQALPNLVEFPAVMVLSFIFLFLCSVPGLIATPAMAKIQGWMMIPMFGWMVSCHWLLQVSHFSFDYAYVAGWMGLMTLMHLAAPCVYGSRVVRLSRPAHLVPPAY